MNECVVLVDEENNEIGTELKDNVHTSNTPLHRGFSLFLFNSQNELLLTKRSKHKKTFPGVWTNTVCGHPLPEESVADAAKRRLKEELGIDLDFKRPRLAKQGEALIREVAPYRYRFVDANGIVENEICPILIAHRDASPHPKAQEVADWKWMKLEKFLKDAHLHPDQYSPWSIEESFIVEQYLHTQTQAAA